MKVKTAVRRDTRREKIIEIGRRVRRSHLGAYQRGSTDGEGFRRSSTEEVDGGRAGRDSVIEATRERFPEDHRGLEVLQPRGIRMEGLAQGELPGRQKLGDRWW